jgi:hypothetical protein
VIGRHSRKYNRHFYVNKKPSWRAEKRPVDGFLFIRGKAGLYRFSV